MKEKFIANKKNIYIIYNINCGIIFFIIFLNLKKFFFVFFDIH